MCISSYIYNKNISQYLRKSHEHKKTIFFACSAGEDSGDLQIHAVLPESSPLAHTKYGNCTYHMCDQQGLRQDCPFVQSRQSIGFSHTYLWKLMYVQTKPEHKAPLGSWTHMFNKMTNFLSTSVIC